MKRLLLVGLAIIAMSCTNNAETTKVDAKDDAKDTKELTQDIWTTYSQKALDKAKKENKYILMDFTGSDWCGWCIKLDKNF